MAGPLHQRKRFSGARGRRTRPMADINVTPMVDVMLVLLVIFMVAAPLLTVGVEVDLPKTSAKQIQGQDEPLAITIKGDGEIYLQNTKVTVESLVPRLNEISRQNHDLRVFVRGDRGVAYGRVMEVMGLLNTSGYTKVALIAEQPQDAGVTKPAAGGKPAPGARK